MGGSLKVPHTEEPFCSGNTGPLMPETSWRRHPSLHSCSEAPPPQARPSGLVGGAGQKTSGSAFSATATVQPCII